MRRSLERLSFIDFLQQLAQTTPPPYAANGKLLIESPCMNVACRYEFSTCKDPKLDCLFEVTTAPLLHYILGAILLERRVVLVGKHEKRLSDAVFALLALCCEDAPLRGYPHNLVPVLPLSMLELGLGNPAPYVVGLLRYHLEDMDALPQLGDIVIVDLDVRSIRLTPGAQSIMPLGTDPNADGVNTLRRDEAELRPWADVCGPFSKDLVVAFNNRDVDLLASSVRAVILVATLGKVGAHLDDPVLQQFASAFRKTSIAAPAVAQESPITAMLGSRGYSFLKSQLAQQQIAATSAERNALVLAKNAVFELTSVSGKSRPELVNKATTEIAKRSFDCFAHVEGTQVAIRQRLLDCSGRNWKHAYKTLGLLGLLVRAGSELVVAGCWNDMALIYELTKYTAGGALGVPARVADLVQKRAIELYVLVVDLHTLAFSRGFQGHVMIRRAVKQRMQTDVTRVVMGGRDFESMLDICAPPTTVLAESFDDADDKEPTQTFRAPRPRTSNDAPPPPDQSDTLLDFGFPDRSSPTAAETDQGSKPNRPMAPKPSYVNSPPPLPLNASFITTPVVSKSAPSRPAPTLASVAAVAPSVISMASALPMPVAIRAAPTAPPAPAAIPIVATAERKFVPARATPTLPSKTQPNRVDVLTSPSSSPPIVVAAEQSFLPQLTVEGNIQRVHSNENVSSPAMVVSSRAVSVAAAVVVPSRNVAVMAPVMAKAVAVPSRAVMAPPMAEAVVVPNRAVMAPPMAEAVVVPSRAVMAPLMAEAVVVPSRPVRLAPVVPLQNSAEPERKLSSPSIADTKHVPVVPGSMEASVDSAVAMQQRKSRGPPPPGIGNPRPDLV